MPLRWLRRRPRPVRRPNDASVDGLLSMLAERVHAPQRASAVLSRAAAFAALAPGEQERELPGLYLLFEHYLAEADSRPVERAALRRSVRERFPALLEQEAFRLVLEDEPLQEVLLCRFMLGRVVDRAAALLGGTGGQSIAALRAWLRDVPASVGPTPIPGEAADDPSLEWVARLEQTAAALHRHLASLVGERSATALFETGYRETSESYAGLECFPVVIGLLPERLLDEQKIVLLSRRQVQRVVLDQVEKLQRVNERLSAQNHELEQVRRELQAAKGELEKRVVERTAALQNATRSLESEMTERKQLEMRLLQSQKMEAVGRLAGGIAHDFNNLLTAMRGHASFLLEALEPGSDLHEDATGVQQAVDRAASLTRQLLAFSRRQLLQPKVLELNSIVRDVERMLGRLIGEHVELVTRTASDLGRVRADPGQIEQVIVNLAVNARDAMPDGGTLLIETHNADMDPQYVRGHPEVPPGRYVLLAVTDTGRGMDEATQGQIFEPFFTTKEVGKGTGLGLATVYGIVQQSGGFVWVYSEVGKGTTFKVYLPRVDAPGEVAPAAPEVPARGNGETVLLVEDDRAVRLLARRVLERGGYRVLVADNGAAALRLAAGSDAIDLLLTDVVMPELGGRELAERLAAERPGLAVLCMSGYTDDAVLRHGMSTDGAAFLEKPFTPDGLLRRVRETIGP